MIHLLECAGYSEQDIRICHNIAADVIYNIVNFDGDIVTFRKGHSSGHPLTVIINSIANSILMRMAFSMLGGEVKTFKRYVKLLTYGDDNIASVSSEVPFFNQVNITGVFSQLGIVYTMADKEAEVVPYITLDEAEFLKRTFVYDGERQCCWAPIALKSMMKSLGYRVNNGTITPYEHAWNVLQNYLFEKFEYGEMEYLQSMEWVLYVVKTYNIDKYNNIKLLSYSEMWEQRCSR
jgi:hypothetical protein